MYTFPAASMHGRVALVTPPVVVPTGVGVVVPVGVVPVGVVPVGVVPVGVVPVGVVPVGVVPVGVVPVGVVPVGVDAGDEVPPVVVPVAGGLLGEAGVVPADVETPQVVIPGIPPGIAGGLDVSASAATGSPATSSPIAAATAAHRGCAVIRDLLLVAARRGRPPSCSMSGQLHHRAQAVTFTTGWLADYSVTHSPATVLLRRHGTTTSATKKPVEFAPSS
jgi:hypothetical protein